MRLHRLIEVMKRRAGFDVCASVRGIDTNVPHGREIDHQAVVANGVTGEESSSNWEWADVVFLSVMMAQREDYRECVANAKMRGKPVAVGGLYDPCAAGGCLRRCRLGCFGETESIVEQLAATCALIVAANSIKAARLRIWRSSKFLASSFTRRQRLRHAGAAILARLSIYWKVSARPAITLWRELLYSQSEMTRREYLEGYRELVQEIYQPKAYFARTLSGLLALQPKAPLGAVRRLGTKLLVVLLKESYYFGLRAKPVRPYFWKAFLQILRKSRGGAGVVRL